MKQIEAKKFYPELETLRAIAVLMVLMAHFIPEDSFFYIPYLWYGVDLFFTISGFLITSILLKARFMTDKSNKTLLKNFYMRRALRLFPVYYLFIFFFYFAKHWGNLQMWNDDYNFYFFTYFQNIYFFKLGNFNSMFSHLWSLGVEEQFYMVWPFVILFLSKRWLPYLFGFIIFMSLSLITIFQDVPLFRSLTFANFHTLGIGALFAYFHICKPHNIIFDKIRSNRTLITIVLTPIFIITLIYSYKLGGVGPLILEFMLAITMVAYVITSTYGWQLNLKYITQNKILMHIGKISYGIYLFHLPLPAICAVFYHKLTGQDLIIPHELFSFLLFTTLTIIIAHFSFKWIETPFLNLKKKFE
ncbi:acyltransferase [Gelidibacter salicanalis]|uniref:Acyltransferase n=1 Tax=Gelidibacter salicanalis TaxID=291193 RepID=A0A5C7AS00_9FLAO|nr:acyltransferase [Gelidibacter salicanalis]TXE09275.1 acyltransferase [Gelidibacter salicanalis]